MTISSSATLHLKQLIATEKTKRLRSHICAKCSIDIVVGERYMSVAYNDGYKHKLYGAFHSECWKSFLNGT